MTSRERIRAALQHEPVDRVPIDLGSTYVTGICLPSHKGVVELLGLPERDYVITDPMQMLCRVDDDVLEALHVDVVGVHPPRNSFGIMNEDYIEWQIHPELSCKIPSSLVLSRRIDGGWEFTPPGSTIPSAAMPAGQMFFDLLTRQEQVDIEELTPEMARRDADIKFGVLRDGELAYYERISRQLYQDTDYGIVANINVCALGGYLRIVSPDTAHAPGIGDPSLWYITLLLNEPYIRELFARQTEIALQNLKLLKQAFGDRIDAIFISGTDFGTQNALLFSRDIFVSLYKPFYRKVNDWIHANTGWKTFYHSCGAVSELLDDFVEMGADIINPIQLSAAGMEPNGLMKHFGGKLVFWGGGIDTQRTFPRGTEQEVVDEVRHNVGVFTAADSKDNGISGGFVFTPVHNIQADVPPENILAAYKTAAEWK